MYRYFALTLVLVLSVFVVCPCFAFDLEADVDWIDFSDWSHEEVSTSGQVFNVATDDVDVVVFASGEFSLPSIPYDSGRGFVSQNLVAETQKFHFAMSKPVRLVVRYTSTDDFENLDVFAMEVGPVEHEGGANPLVIEGDMRRRITGTGNMIGENGAARGHFELGETTRFTIVHEGLVASKYEAIEIGIVRTAAVPEPAGNWLMGVAVSGLLVMERRKRRSA